MSVDFLANLPRRRAQGQRAGITSVCSAHPDVIRAACNADAGLPAALTAQAALEQAVTCVLQRYRRAIQGE